MKIGSIIMVLFFLAVGLTLIALEPQLKDLNDLESWTPDNNISIETGDVCGKIDLRINDD